MSVRKLSILLVLSALFSAPVLGAATVVTADSTASWNGYMNWTHQYPAPNASNNGGNGWGLADLTAVFDDPNQNLVLGPNTINVLATDAYWYIAGSPPLGTKDMEANLYIEETGPLAGTTVTFEGDVGSFGFSSGYTLRAYISDFAADYSSRVDSFLPITASGPFSLDLTTNSDPARHVQYGFQVVGRNIHPTDTAGIAAAGSVTLNTVPEPTAAIMAFVLGLSVFLIRRR